MNVVCADCRAENIIPDHPERGKRYRCGNCGATLAGASGAPRDRVQRDRPPRTSAKPRTAGRLLRTASKSLPVVHPLLFALFPVLALYSFNVTEVSPKEIVVPTAMAVGCSALLLLVLSPVLRGLPRAAIITSVFFVLFFSYGHILNVLVGSPTDGWLWLLLFIAWTALFALAVRWIVRTRRDLHRATVVLTVTAAVLVAVPAIHVIASETGYANTNTERIGNTVIPITARGQPDVLPDIYYIVPDRYASASVLEDLYGFDNSDYVSWLGEKGFYVASDSYSNYPRTPSSLASSLNMEYINYLTERVGRDSLSLLPMYEMIEDHEVGSFLKSQGYKYIHIGSSWEPTRENEHADANYNYSEMSEFSMLVLETTMLYPVLVKTGVMEDERLRHRNSILYAFDTIAAIPDIEDPTFTFVHLPTPHPPFVFDRNGDYVTQEEEDSRDRKSNYMDQLTHVNSMFMELIEVLLERSEVPPVIIIQADEGPGKVEGKIAGKLQGGTWHYDYEQATPAQLRQKMGILNAYYLPGVDHGVLYPSITPVNSFRLVFAHYFGADIELLEDRCYAYSESYPYRFFEVTDKLTGDEDGSAEDPR
jgi:hypothetical protein